MYTENEILVESDGDEVANKYGTKKNKKMKQKKREIN